MEKLRVSFLFPKPLVNSIEENDIGDKKIKKHDKRLAQHFAQLKQLTCDVEKGSRKDKNLIDPVENDWEVAPFEVSNYYKNRPHCRTTDRIDDQQGINVGMPEHFFFSFTHFSKVDRTKISYSFCFGKAFAINSTKNLLKL